MVIIVVELLGNHINFSVKFWRFFPWHLIVQVNL